MRRAVLLAAQPSRRDATAALVLGVLAAGSAVALLATSAWLIARAAEQPPILFLGFAIVGVRAFALGRAVFRYLERLVAHDGAFRALARLRVAVFRRLLPVAPDGLRATRRGDVLTTLVRDVDTLQDLPLRVVQPLVSGLVVAGLAVVGVAWLSPTAATVLGLGLILTLAVATGLVTALGRDAERRIAPLRADLVDGVLDYLARFDVLRAYGADTAARVAINELDAQLRRAQTRQSAAAGAVAAVFTLAGGALLIVSASVVAPEFAFGTLTGPQLVLLALLPLAVIDAVAVLPLALAAWWRVRASAERIATVVPDQRPPGIPVPPATAQLAPAGDATIVLRGVTARWPGAATAALASVDLELRAGDRLLVTGSSGAGKTTLAHVLVRFLDHEGVFTLGGVDVRSLHPDTVRERIVLCEQQPHLFDESIRQNLVFARENADDDDLLEVLDRVGLAQWAAERGGLDAPVGERGELVSGGQAQRLALARALLIQAPVLVLDEPTANVDADRADTLLEELLGAAASPDRAVLVISHTPIDDRLLTGRLHLAAAR